MTSLAMIFDSIFLHFHDGHCKPSTYKQIQYKLYGVQGGAEQGQNSTDMLVNQCVMAAECWNAPLSHTTMRGGFLPLSLSPWPAQVSYLEQIMS